MSWHVHPPTHLQPFLFFQHLVWMHSLFCNQPHSCIHMHILPYIGQLACHETRKKFLPSVSQCVTKPSLPPVCSYSEEKGCQVLSCCIKLGRHINAGIQSNVALISYKCTQQQMCRRCLANVLVSSPWRDNARKSLEILRHALLLVCLPDST